MALGLDALLLMFLVVARLHWLAAQLSPSVLPAMTLLTAAYVAADLLLRPRRPRAAQLLKLLLLALVLTAYVGVPLLRVILARHLSGKPWLWAHDNVIQMEEAIKFLLRGQNPYAVDYTQTPLLQWDPQNPALYHSVNLPLQFLLGVPFYLLAMPALGWFDLRMVYALVFVATCVVVYRLGRDREAALAQVMLFALNPFFTSTLIEGRNDVVVMLCLAATMLHWQRGRRRAAMVWLGLTLTTKHTIVVLLPFALLALMLEAGDDGAAWLPWLRARLWGALRALAPALLVAAALTLPFVLWSPLAVYRSVIAYPFGTAAHSYPIRDDSYGLANWIIRLGLVKSDADYFPFLWVQLAAALPCLLALLRWQRRQATATAMLLAYALTLFVTQWTARYFNQNHVAFVWFVIAMALLLRARAGATGATSPPASAAPSAT